MRADSEAEREIFGAVEQLTKAYEARDVEAIAALFVADPGTTVIGTGKDERRLGLAEIRMQIERDFAQSEGAKWKLGWRTVSHAGNFAWVAAEADLQVRAGGQSIAMPLRMTAALEKKGDRWQFHQLHVSTPTPEQAEGQSWPTD
jgi:ketosteroid isomerase-like protein